jgi:uncharacterized protein (TIGR02266 family)
VGADAKSGDERRQYERRNLILRVDYSDAAQFLKDYTENVSEGGVFIATESPYAVGERVEFEVSFPGLLDAVAMKGVVRWTRPATPGNDAGIGVQFDEEVGPEGGFLRRLQARGRPASDSEDVAFCILLVEDNLVVRDMFRFGLQKFTTQLQLSRTRIDVDEAGDGKQAWDLLQKKHYHLLIIDLYMPVMDGGTLIQRIRDSESLRSTPIMVVSSGGSEGRAVAARAGADVYLDKPIKLRQMTETIATLIALGHRPRRK